MSRIASQRAAFTLVELLVVIALADSDFGCIAAPGVGKSSRGRPNYELPQ